MQELQDKAERRFFLTKQFVLEAAIAKVAISPRYGPGAPCLAVNAAYLLSYLRLRRFDINILPLFTGNALIKQFIYFGLDSLDSIGALHD